MLVSLLTGLPTTWLEIELVQGVVAYETVIFETFKELEFQFL